LTCPIFAFGGIDDPEIEYNVLKDWRHHTASSFFLRMIPGGHFFIESEKDLFLNQLSNDLNDIVNGVCTRRIAIVRVLNIVEGQGQWFPHETNIETRGKKNCIAK
jgi:hypothetical protein